ncbi:MAG TPA: putative quinol monooxygenase [Terriglobales bacterium]|nr:putative quinol monooxygenase [Terriglobales bacterium]
MIVLAVIWVTKPGHAEEAAKIFQVLTAESCKEPGCLMYVVHRHRSDPSRFFIYEQYVDDAALEAHRNSQHFLEYARKQLPLHGERMQGDLYEPID